MPGFANVGLSFFVPLCQPQAVLNQIILYNDFLQLILAALSVCSRLAPGGTARIRPVYAAHALLCYLATDFANVFLDNITEILRTYSILPMPKQPARRLVTH